MLEKVNDINRSKDSTVLRLKIKILVKEVGSPVSFSAPLLSSVSQERFGSESFLRRTKIRPRSSSHPPEVLLSNINIFVF